MTGSFWGTNSFSKQGVDWHVSLSDSIVLKIWGGPDGFGSKPKGCEFFSKNELVSLFPSPRCYNTIVPKCTSDKKSQ